MLARETCFRAPDLSLQVARLRVRHPVYSIRIFVHAMVTLAIGEIGTLHDARLAELAAAEISCNT